jgi:hypothetical protein
MERLGADTEAAYQAQIKAAGQMDQISEYILLTNNYRIPRSIL